MGTCSSRRRHGATGCCCGEIFSRSATGDRGIGFSAEEGNHTPVSGIRCICCCRPKVHLHRGAPILKSPKARVARLRVIIIIVGSRGDVQPFVAFAMALRRHDHTVCIATHKKSFGWADSLCRSEGIEFLDIGGNPELLMQFAVEHPNLISFNMAKIREQQSILYEIFLGADQACRTFCPDVMISNPPVIVHTHLAERYKVPLQIHFTMPWSPTDAYPNPCAPGSGVFGNMESYHILDELLWVGNKTNVNKYRATALSLPECLQGAGLQHKMEIPHLYCASPQLMPKPADWGPHITVVGFWNLPKGSDTFSPEHRDWDPNLVTFLEESQKSDLLYIGFGSIQCENPKKLSTRIMGAIDIVKQRRGNLRTLVSPGWAGLGESYRTVTFSLPEASALGIEWQDTSVKAVAEGSVAAGMRLQDGSPAVVAGKVDGVPAMRALRMGIDDGKMERVYSRQDIDAVLLKVSVRLSSSRSRAAGSSTACSTKLRIEFGTMQSRPDVYLVGRCPHDWLFPHCRAVVHHGGAGTTATGLIAGCCTCVVPFFGDQPFWGACCHREGVGPEPIPVNDMKDKSLADAIELMMGSSADPSTVTTQMWSRVSELSTALRHEDGVARGVQAFHHMLDVDSTSLGYSVWQNQTLVGGTWQPSSLELGWPAWSDRTGWLEFHRAEDADLTQPPDVSEMHTSPDWVWGDWVVWSQQAVLRESGGTKVEMDDQGWQYSLKWKKQATDPAWHGAAEWADCVRRRRWTRRQRRVPPLVFARISRRGLGGYYKREPGQMMWRRQRGQKRRASSRSDHEPFAEGSMTDADATLQRSADGHWVVQCCGKPVLVSASKVSLPTEESTWYLPAEPGEEREEDGPAEVTEPSAFAVGEKAECKVPGSRSGLPTTWRKVTVDQPDTVAGYVNVIDDKGDEEIVGLHHLRRPVLVSLDDPGQLATRRSAIYEDEVSEEESACTDDCAEDLVDVAEDGAQHLLDAFVRTSKQQVLDKAMTLMGLTSRQNSADGLTSFGFEQRSATDIPQTASVGGSQPPSPSHSREAICAELGAKRSSMVRAARDRLKAGGSFRRGGSCRSFHRPTSGTGSFAKTPQELGVEVPAAEAHRMPLVERKARDCTMLMLLTRIGEERVVLRAKGCQVARSEPDPLAPPQGPALADGERFVLCEVKPSTDDIIWARVQPAPVAATEPIADGDHAGPARWIDITEQVGDAACDMEDGDEVFVAEGTSNPSFAFIPRE
eukprot:TRINITY_DN43778_c0_g1_i1.p1 TRINITY_DN43778_c0_g1~~TRINITY_DN43778_c0_g1_i1.p1  ORF type:complete len:1232 (+),score=253.74 TRINITY_DN43778_c0_g1_i1:62-3757(+)